MLVLNRIYNLLKRTTASTQFIPAIDGLRFLAIWVVVADHLQGFIRTKLSYDIATPASTTYWYIYQFIDSNGLKGVLLFFMISGFILGLPFAKQYIYGEKPVKLKNYFLRRLTRLEPPYIFNTLALYFLIFFYAGNGFAGLFPKSFSELWPLILSSLTYTHNIFFSQNMAINPVTWSLEVEVQFYLLVPLLVLVFTLAKAWRRGLLVFFIVYFTWLSGRYKLPVVTIYSFIQYFLAGFLLVDIYLSGFRVKLKNIYTFVIGIALLTAFMYLDTYGLKHFNFYFLPVCFGVFLLAVTSEFWEKVFSFKIFTSIGGMCYSIYLWHEQIISAVGNISVRFNPSHAYIPTLLWQYLLVMPVILVGCSVFYLLIEKPCMDKEWPKKVWLFIKIKILRKTQSV